MFKLGLLHHQLGNLAILGSSDIKQKCGHFFSSAKKIHNLKHLYFIIKGSFILISILNAYRLQSWVLILVCIVNCLLRELKKSYTNFDKISSLVQGSSQAEQKYVRGPNVWELACENADSMSSCCMCQRQLVGSTTLLFVFSYLIISSLLAVYSIG